MAAANLSPAARYVSIGVMLAVCGYTVAAQQIVVRQPAIPVITNVERVTQLPAEVPQRVSAIAFHDGKLWIALYAAGNRHVRFDPLYGQWDLAQDRAVSSATRKVTGGGTGGWVFVNGRLWLGNVGGDIGIYGWADLSDTNQFLRLEKSRDDEARWEVKRRSHAFTGFTYDGTYLWASWNVCEYAAPLAEVQRLLKIDNSTGQIIANYPLPYGSPADSARGLTWDGQKLWYAYGSDLLALDITGNVLGHYKLGGVHRTAGLAWDGEALWIAEFDGQLWRVHVVDLPATTTSQIP